MNDVLMFLFKPTKTIVDIIWRKNNFKFLVITIILLLSTLILLFKGYYLNKLWINITIFWYKYVWLFFYSIIISLFFSFVIFIIWKQYSWKSNYVDVLLTITLASIPYSIFFNLIWLFYIFNPLSNIIKIVVGISFYIWLLWSLILLSKWLSKIEEISETKVAIIFIISLIIYYVVDLYIWNYFILR